MTPYRCPDCQRYKGTIHGLCADCAAARMIRLSQTINREGKRP